MTPICLYAGVINYYKRMSPGIVKELHCIYYISYTQTTAVAEEPQYNWGIVFNPSNFYFKFCMVIIINCEVQYNIGTVMRYLEIYVPWKFKK